MNRSGELDGDNFDLQSLNFLVLACYLLESYGVYVTHALFSC